MTISSGLGTPQFCDYFYFGFYLFCNLALISRLALQRGMRCVWVLWWEHALAPGGQTRCDIGWALTQIPAACVLMPDRPVTAQHNFHDETKWCEVGEKNQISF